MSHLADRLVRTSFADGLTDEHVDRAIEMLMAPMPALVTATPEAVARFAP